MEAKLRVMEGSSAGREIPVVGPRFFIGRADDCQLRPRSDLVSRHHCVILIEGSFVGVRDFGSKNGTLVNDEPVKGERELKSGDRLTVGALRFEVRLSEPEQKTEPPAGPSEEATVQTASHAVDESVSDGELDLSNWFGAAESAAGVGASTETVDLSKLTSSRQFDKAKPGSESASQTQDPHQPAKKVPGGFAAKAKAAQPADSSRNAAEEALRKMRKSRH